LDLASTLEITNCFAFPNKPGDDDDEGDAEGQEYQMEMMRCLREVNVDNNTVGWYTSLEMGMLVKEKTLMENTVETQFNYQDRIGEKSVALFYDPIKSFQSVLWMRAFRLSRSFMDLYRSQSFSKESVTKHNVTFSNIFEEVPVKIRNSPLTSALLLQLEESGSLRSNTEVLSLATNSFVEKNMEILNDSFDELSNEQTKFQKHQKNVAVQQAHQQLWLTKRRAENAQRKSRGEPTLPEEDPTSSSFRPVPEPSRLPSLLFANQTNDYSKRLNSVAATSLAKYYLFAGLVKDQES